MRQPPRYIVICGGGVPAFREFVPPPPPCPRPLPSPLHPITPIPKGGLRGAFFFKKVTWDDRGKRLLGDLEFETWDCGFGTWNSEPGIWILGFRMWDLGCGVWSLEQWTFAIRTMEPGIRNIGRWNLE